MSPAFHRPLRRILASSGGIAAAAAIYLAYRWAEPDRLMVAVPSSVTPASDVAIHLEKTPFSGSDNGKPSWSLWAGSIDIERIPGMGLASIQTAAISDIRDGLLFSSTPERAGTAHGAHVRRSGGPAVVGRFRADRGRYSLGNLDPFPADLALLYVLKWQFKLSGNVVLSAASGDRLEAPALDILEMTNRRTGRLDRIVVCDSGATVTLRDARVQANTARYDPANRSVDCLGGVLGKFHDGSVQTERFFWSLGEEKMRCPDRTSGSFQGMPFQGDDVTVDLRNRKLRASHFVGRPRI